MSTGPVVSVDGDVLRYSIGAVCDTDQYVASKDDDVVFIGSNRTEMKDELGDDWEAQYTVKRQVKAEPVENALHSCKAVLESINTRTNARKLNVYLGSSTNYRKDISKLLPYKGNRLTRVKMQELKETGQYPHFFEQYPNKFGLGRPTHFDALTDYMVDYWGAEIIEGIEVDDYLAMEQTRAWNWARDKMNPEDALKNNGHVLASIDKDLMQVPGVFFDWRSDAIRQVGVETWEYITPHAAMVNLWAQSCCGDMTDNIYGIEGLGLKGAKAKLEKAFATSTEKFDWSAWRYKQYEEWFGVCEAKHKAGKKLKPITRTVIMDYTPKEYADEMYDLIYLLRTKEEAAKYVKDEEEETGPE